MKLIVKNQEMYALLKSYTQKAIDLIKGEIKIEDIQSIQQFTWVYVGNNSFRREIEIKKYWPQYFLNFKNKLRSIPEYNKLIGIIGNNYFAEGRLDIQPYTTKSSSNVGGDGVINYILYRLLVEKDRALFSLSRFDYYYSKLENKLTSDFIEQERITILQGLHLPINRFELTKHMEIAKLKPNDILEMLNRDIPLGRESFGQLNDLQFYAIKYIYRVKKENLQEDVNKSKNSGNDFSFEQNEQMILNLLRIFKKGKFLPVLTLFGNDLLFVKTYSWILLNQPEYWIHDNYKLDRHEMNKIKRLFQKTGIKQLQKQGTLNIALSRFGQALDRKSIEDKIIDFSICAEALFLNDGGSNQGELKYRLSLRASFFIGTNETNRKKIFSDMKCFYDLRSQIVHGTAPNKYKLPNKQESTKYRFDEFTELIEGYLRMALLKAVKIVIEPKSNKYKFDWEEMILGKTD